MPRTRRSLLKIGGSALATLAVAGCIESSDAPGAGTTDTPAPTDSPTATPPPTGTDTPAPTTSQAPTEMATEPPTETPTETPPMTPPGAPNFYPRWLPAPSATGRDHYWITSAAVGSLLDMQGQLGGATDPLTGEYPVPGIPTWGDVETFHRIEQIARVTTANVDRATAEESLRGTASDEWSNQGYTLFETKSMVVAVGDEAVVDAQTGGSGSSDDERRAVEAVLDARAGEADRYEDASAACDRLFSAIGPAHVFRARTHGPDTGFEGAVADAIAYYVAPEQTEVHAPVVFESGATDESVVSEWASEASVFRDQAIDVTVDGRLVTATATVPSSDLGQFSGQFPGRGSQSPGSGAPTVAFTFDYEETADGQGVLTITHDGGDAVAADQVFLRGEGFTAVDADVDQTSPGRWQGSVSGDDAHVVAGDRNSVGVSSDYEITVNWESADGNVSATLQADEGPDA